MKLWLYVILSFCAGNICHAQSSITGTVLTDGGTVPYATIRIAGSRQGTVADSNGHFALERRTLPLQLIISAQGYISQRINVTTDTVLSIYLTEDRHEMNEVVISGDKTWRKRTDDAFTTELYTADYFRKNPTPSLFDAVGMINGVQPQVNCNVCNTGDIRINGMDGPYTLILIDGMPIVSALSTVYGLSGIPNSMIERIEVTKGPAAALYGSDAMGGVINVVTRDATKAPRLGIDLFATSWQEVNADLSTRLRMGKLQQLTGLNYYRYQNPIDNNDDGFTDVTLQDRISLFSKWGLTRKDNRTATLAARYVYENRWGGQMSWTDDWRGSDSIYGESIYTKRIEVLGLYQLPVKEKLMLQYSWNRHNQNSYYGNTPYMANQQVAFAQLYWDKKLSNRNNLLSGATFRYTLYDDNSPATASPDGSSNQPSKKPQPGIFVQDEYSPNERHKLILGYRYDHDNTHGNIHSPRIAWKYTGNRSNELRASAGKGYRVVNLFTEDHAALTGARQVVIAEKLQPEESYNANLSYDQAIPFDGFFVDVDATAFYNYFTNKIIGDFDTDPNKIIYQNLAGHAATRGVSLNVSSSFTSSLRMMTGITYMDAYQTTETGDNKSLLYTPAWTGNFLISYQLPQNILLDISGRWNGPMRMPILPNDYRAAYSPWYCIANVQLSKKLKNEIEFYGGVKNIFNIVSRDPIMRAHDPFDKQSADPVSNPYGYTFDPGYSYTSMQGARAFIGARYTLN